MLEPFHVEIMHLALDGACSPSALEKIIKAHLYQDRLRGQIGHDEYHFDNIQNPTPILKNRALTVSSLVANDAPLAWSAFGRLTHTAQDFYAHSNYIDLWLAFQPDGALPTPPEVTPMDPDLINTPALRSGKVYVLELLTLIPFLRPFVMPLLPRDAHGWMNLDSPDRGPNFGAFKYGQTDEDRVETTTKDLPEELVALFVDR
jgi:hypothetical protein